MSAPETLIPGYATAEGTQAYLSGPGSQCAEGHFSDFGSARLKLSAIGIGSFPGAATDAVDEAYGAIVEKALCSGINLVDTAAHYRYGRSARAIGTGLARAFAQGLRRDQVFVIGKGGFLSFPEGPPPDPEAWYEREIIARGWGERDDLAGGVHLMTPRYLKAQSASLRAALGLATLDAFLIDQPEVEIAHVGKQTLIRRLDQAFVALEEEVRAGHIRCYGVSSFHALRVVQDESAFLSLASLVALAERAARDVFGEGAAHHLVMVELPFNAVMPEAFTRFNQVTGQGNEASVLQAALQLGLFTVASHTLFKGHLARVSPDALVQTMPTLTPAERAIQFNRSTPGLGATLVGISTMDHLEAVLRVAQRPLLSRDVYLAMFEKAG